LCRVSGRRRAHDDDVGLETHTFRCQHGKLLATAVRNKVVDGDGLPMHIAGVAKAREERLESRRWRLRCAWIKRQEAQPGNFPCRLPFSNEWQNLKAERENAPD